MRRVQLAALSRVLWAVALGLLSACSEGANRDAATVPEGDADPEASASGMGGSGPGDSGTGGNPWGDGGPCDPEARSAAPMALLFEPAGLPNVPLDGLGGAMTLFASTLVEGPTGFELYAGVCNDGEFPLCSAAIQVEFYDRADEFIGTASGSVQSGRLYRFSESPTPISCVAPGQTAMAAVSDLPEGLTLAALKSLGHRFPAFRIDDAELLSSVTVSDVEAFDTAGGAAFRGTVTNASDTLVKNPVVSVFPVNDVGRPLGLAKGAVTLELPPGGTWSFETSVVADRGVTQLAFASGSLVTSP